MRRKGRQVFPAKSYAARAERAREAAAVRKPQVDRPVVDVWLAGEGRSYVVVVDGVVYDAITVSEGFPLPTHSELIDIAAGYKEALQ